MGRRTEESLELQERVVYRFLVYRIKLQKKRNERSIKVSYRWISYATGLTYKEVRNTIKRLIHKEEIIQYTVKKDLMRECYYRLPR